MKRAWRVTQAPWSYRSEVVALDQSCIEIVLERHACVFLWVKRKVLEVVLFHVSHHPSRIRSSWLLCERLTDWILHFLRLHNDSRLLVHTITTNPFSYSKQFALQVYCVSLKVSAPLLQSDKWILHKTRFRSISWHIDHIPSWARRLL